MLELIDTTLIAVVLGFALHAVPSWWRKHKNNKAQLISLAIELKDCKELATVYRSQKIASPLYRLPTMSFDRILPELLSDGIIKKPDDIQALVRFKSQVEQMNRGLDYVNERRVDAEKSGRQPEEDLMNKEVSRLYAKAEELEGTLFEKAHAALGRKVSLNF